MLTQKAAKTAENVVNKLKECGWLPCSTNNTAVTKNGCYVYFDEQTSLPSEFSYKDGETTSISLSLVSRIDKATWHAEYEDSVVAFGKIPQTFSSPYSSMNDNGKRAADDFVQNLEEVARGAKQRQALGICTPVCTYVSVKTPIFTKIKELDEMSETVILAGEKIGTEFYRILKNPKSADSYLMIRVTLDQDQTGYKLLMTQKDVGECSIVEASVLKQFISGGQYFLYNVEDTFKEIQVYNWTQSKFTLKDVTKNIYDLIPSITLDKEQEYYVNLAYERNYDLSQILSHNYDATTLRWLIQFMGLSYSSELITENYDDSVLAILYKLALECFPIHRYLNTSYTAADIESLHSSYLNEVAELKERLKNKNFSQDAIKAISYIYAYRTDLSHVMYNEPEAKLHLRDYALDGDCPVLTNFLLNNGDVQGSLVHCSSAALTPELLEEAKRFIHCDVMVNGVPWDEFVHANEMIQIYFRKGSGIVVETKAGSIYRTKASLVFSKDSHNADARVINVGGELLVEC